jgi:hypothetical protein
MTDAEIKKALEQLNPLRPIIVAGSHMILNYQEMLINRASPGTWIYPRHRSRPSQHLLGDHSFTELPQGRKNA